MTKIEKTTTQLPRPSPAALQATLVTISAAYLPSVTKASTVIQHNDHGGLTIVVDYITLQMVLVTGIFVLIGLLFYVYSVGWRAGALFQAVANRTSTSPLESTGSSAAAQMRMYASLQAPSGAVPAPTEPTGSGAPLPPTAKKIKPFADTCIITRNAFDSGLAHNKMCSSLRTHARGTRTLALCTRCAEES